MADLTHSHTGPFGYADRIPLGPDLPVIKTATLAAWLVHIPSASPAWADYELSVIHLRSIPGEVDPHRQYPEAAYEITMFALDPSRSPRADDRETLQPLFPINITEQFHGVIDEQAIEIADGCVEGMVVGMLAAEPDWQPQRALWRSVIRNTAQHAATGGHEGGYVA